MRHVMVDIETLGTRPGSVILSIGAVPFDSTYIGTGLHVKIDVFDSLLAGLTIDPLTVEWWRKQDREVQLAAMYDADTLANALAYLDSFLQDGDLVWAKGPDFDLVLLGAAYEKCGMPKPWRYGNTRDVRTVLGWAPPSYVQPSNTLAHSAIEDARTQARLVQEICALRGLPL